MSGAMFVDENSEEEEEGFGIDDDPQKSSARLASLFAHEGNLKGNDTLVYTAPKQPSAAQKPAPTSSSSSSVLNATVVYAFMLKDGKFQPLGKVGLAVVFYSEKKEGMILLYHANRKPVTQAVIGSGAGLTVQTDTYVSLCDVNGLQWSLAFDTHEQLTTFCKWYMCCRGFQSNEHETQLLSLDLQSGEGNKVSAGDLLEVEYVEYLIESGPSFTEFNGNFNSDQVLRLKLGKGKMPKGWEDGIVGMRKSGQRLFVIPPDVGYSGHATSPSFPTNSRLMVLVHVKRVKFGAAGKHSEASLSITDNSAPDEEAEEQLAHISDENLSDTITDYIEKSIPLLQHSEEAVVQEEEESVEEKKASLLNRMARIGQPLLPGMSAAKASTALPDLVTSDPSTEEIKHPELPPKPVSKPNPIAVVCAELPVKISAPVTTNAAPTTLANPTTSFPQMPFMFPYPHPGMASFYPPAEGPQSQNIPFHPFYPFPIPNQTSDFKLVLEEIRTGQSALRTDLEEFISRKLSEEVQQTRGSEEKETFLFQLSKIRTEKQVETTDRFMEKLNNIEAQLKAMTSAEGEFRSTDIPQKLDILTARVLEEHNWREKYEKLTAQALKLKAQYDEEIRHLKEELSQAKTLAESKISEEQRIKSIMSDFYRSLADELEPGESYSTELLKKMILKLVKECTLRVLTSPEKEETAIISSESDEKEISESASEGLKQESTEVQNENADVVENEDEMMDNIETEVKSLEELENSEDLTESFHSTHDYSPDS